MNGEFKKFWALVRRNIKVYFKDKMLFFVSLITPLILVFLFITFLGNVYETSLLDSAQGVELPSRLVKGFAGGWLFSSIMATSGLTVAFCSNVMVNDKLNRCINDFNITPVRKSTIQLSYLIANFFTTLLVCSAALIVGFVYLAIVGWYLSVWDVLLLLVAMVLNTLFGTLLAGIVEMFLKTQGALSAVCTLMSSLYGFICGAYMPLSQFAPGIRTVVAFLPGTYTTVLFRKYFLNGALTNLRDYLPDSAVDTLANSFDANLTVFDQVVPTWVLFVVVLGTIIALFGLYFLLTYLLNKKRR